VDQKSSHENKKFERSSTKGALKNSDGAGECGGPEVANDSRELERMGCSPPAFVSICVIRWPLPPFVFFVSFMDKIRLPLCMSIDAPSPSPTLRTIRIWLALFIVGLVLSGITAFPLVHELDLLAWFIPNSLPRSEGGLVWWILHVRDGLHAMDAGFPFLAYGTDWLAFGHIVIAMFFVAPLINPVRNIAVLYTGLVACLGVIPLALICGPIRGIPLYWRLIDCSFGVLGVVPLLIVIRLIKRLERAGQTPEVPTKHAN
jgi:hypothetical protein